MKGAYLPAMLGLVLGILAITSPPARAGVTPIASIEDAAHRALSSDDKIRRDATQWLVQNGDLNSAAVLIQLLRWLPDDEEAIVARLETLTGARPGTHWF